MTAVFSGKCLSEVGPSAGITVPQFKACADFLAASHLKAEAVEAEFSNSEKWSPRLVTIKIHSLESTSAQER